MENMDGWDIVLLVGVAFVAITVLVRLMIRHRNELVARLRQEMEQDKKARKKATGAPRRAGEKRRAA
jgi:hypothetical protein